MKALVGFVVICAVIGAFILVLASPEIDWSQPAQTQEIVYARDEAINCDPAEVVGDGSCNVHLVGMDGAWLDGESRVYATNTLADEQCDERQSIGDGECNATVAVLSWQDMALKVLGVLVVAGVIWILVWVAAILK